MGNRTWCSRSPLLVSIGLGVLLRRRPVRWVWSIVAAVTILFAMFDVTEIIHEVTKPLPDSPRSPWSSLSPTPPPP
jgi:hypothetical protein